MTGVRFAVRSSSSNETYFLEAFKTNEGVRFSCTCPAADNGQHCKHRIALASGDGSRLAQPNDEGMRALSEMLAGTRVKATISRIRELERMAESLKKELSVEKKRLAQLFQG